MPGLMPKHLAAMGRGGDDEVAHVTTGELVVPERVQQQPDIRAKLIEAFERAGIPIGRYTVGGKDDSRNPATGMREYRVDGHAGAGHGGSGGYGGGGGSGGGGSRGGYGPGDQPGPNQGRSGGTQGPTGGGPMGGGPEGRSGLLGNVNSFLSNFGQAATAFPGVSLITNPAVAQTFDSLSQHLFGAEKAGPVGASFDHDTKSYFSPGEDRSVSPVAGSGSADGGAADQRRGFYTPPANPNTPSWQRYLDA